MIRTTLTMLAIVGLGIPACGSESDLPLGTGGSGDSPQGGGGIGGQGGTVAGGTGSTGGSGGTATGTASGTPTGGGEECGPIGVWDPAWEAIENELIDLINARRLAGGTCGNQTMPPTNEVALNGLLRSVARAHAEDMGTKDYIAFTSPDGVDWFMQPAACGFGSFPTAQEITAGQTTAQMAFDAVVGASDTNCTNLHAPADFIGVAYYESAASQNGTHWSLYLGSPN